MSLGSCPRFSIIWPGRFQLSTIGLCMLLALALHIAGLPAIGAAGEGSSASGDQGVGDDFVSSDARSALAEEAVIWGFSLVLAGRILEYAEETSVPVNEIRVSTQLADPTLDIAGPNIDTLYGLAWIDLSKGPMVLSVPDTDDRYYSFHLMDMYFDTFAYVGRRTTGTQAGAYALTGPGWSGSLPEGVAALEAPTSTVFAVVRTLVTGPEDLAEAKAIQAQYALGPLSSYPAGQKSAVVRNNVQELLVPQDQYIAGLGATFFDDLNALLEQYPPSETDAARMKRFERLGVGPGKTPSNDPELAPLLAAAVPRAIDRIRARNFSWAEDANNWLANRGVHAYGSGEPMMRASTNVYGPAWHLVQEAIYFPSTQDAEGRALMGEREYALHFPKPPPVDAFWSLCLYGEKFSLVPNEIDRYVINSFTPGLRFNEDGSLDIVVSHGRPRDPQANWLPAPASGPFMLFARAYQPRAELIDGTYTLPPIVRVD